MTTTDRWLQIGEVAERTGLSLRTIRHCAEAGLVAPSGRGGGGIRFYTESDVERLRTVRQMQPLDFSPAEMRELLEITDRLGEPGTEGTELVELRARLETYRRAVDDRCARLRARLALAEDFAATLCRRQNAPA